MALNLLDRISAMANDLSKSERKIAAAVLAQPQLTVSESIAQLAKRAEVSEPTVCRFCKRFGANGFPDFKLALGATMAKDSHSLAASLLQLKDCRLLPRLTAVHAYCVWELLARQ